jgi:hypothetical protein
VNSSTTTGTRLEGVAMMGVWAGELRITIAAKMQSERVIIAVKSTLMAVFSYPVAHQILTAARGYRHLE